ncbi:Uncharacterised protein [Legionella pneumophila]|uniref:Metallo-beta-lactamase family protein, RNA-specific n=1 Tax=Legionella pneumophila TaxID=446 RepID=A0A378K685_LEGPN|nr:metallo-beta lactamase family protein [Legionella pneumophila]WBA03293.1 metallo-beta lactamase family protein [Legionella pneumophila]CZH10064.1 Uncharacterised protein [Legionella pneumophila]CZH56298.1 Uncharacterised protein [Legionella pneumophila]CZI71524.1 Uncharacterised protein [Legionella pneumophila]
MAIDANHLLCTYKDDHHLNEEQCRGLCRAATYVRTPEASKEIDRHKIPQIIISASGMARRRGLLLIIRNGGGQVITCNTIRHITNAIDVSDLIVTNLAKYKFAKAYKK